MVVQCCVFGCMCVVCVYLHPTPCLAVLDEAAALALAAIRSEDGKGDGAALEDVPSEAKADEHKAEAGAVAVAEQVEGATTPAAPVAEKVAGQAVVTAAAPAQNPQSVAERLEGEAAGFTAPTALRILELIGHTMDNCMGVSVELLNDLVIALVAAMVVGTELYGSDGVSLPLWLTACGMAACVAAMSLTATLVHWFGEGASEAKMMWLLRIGYAASSITFLVFSHIATLALHFDVEVRAHSHCVCCSVGCAAQYSVCALITRLCWLQTC